MRVHRVEQASRMSEPVGAVAAWRVRILVATFAIANATMILLAVLDATGVGGAFIQDLKLLCQIQ
jgi:hypothetical protein